MRIKLDLIYPFFLNCCIYTNDPFWKFIFEDLSYGKAPYGSYITKNFLCCNYKGKEFSYKIESNKDSKILFTEVHNLLFKKLGLMSDKDKINKRKAFDITSDEIKINNTTNWSLIKKKTVKNIIIENYVISMKNTYQLTNRQTKKLLSIIIIGLIFKTITNQDINYKNNKILDIEGINFISNKIIMNKNIYDLETSISPEIVIDKKVMADNWEKHLLLLKQRIKGK